MGLTFFLAFAASAFADVAIVKLATKSSNAYLIRSTPPVLVDAGGEGGEKKLVAALRENGVELKDLSQVIFTHGHHDHAGLGAWLKTQGVRTVIGQGDAKLAT